MKRFLVTLGVITASFLVVCLGAAALARCVIVPHFPDPQHNLLAVGLTEGYTVLCVAVLARIAMKMGETG